MRARTACRRQTAPPHVTPSQAPRVTTYIQHGLRLVRHGAGAALPRDQDRAARRFGRGQVFDRAALRDRHVPPARREHDRRVVHVQDDREQRKPLQDGIVLCVAANKCDLEEGREVEVAEGAEFAQKSGADFFETSAKNDENVGRIFTTLVTNVQRKSEAARPAGEARLDAAPPKKTSCCG